MPDSKRSKRDVLIEEGAFNPAPDKVRDPKFRSGEFFDPRDAVQVKYEMLRRVFVDNSTTPVTFWVGSNHGASIIKLEPLE